jgi:hypothetical protein
MEGYYICSVMGQLQAADSYKYAFAIRLGTSFTTFQLYREGTSAPKPAQLILIVDGEEIARLDIFRTDGTPSTGLTYLADMPGNMLAQTVLPRMVAGQSLIVAAGRTNYFMPITGFGGIRSELTACAQAAHALEPGQ